MTSDLATNVITEIILNTCTRVFGHKLIITQGVMKKVKPFSSQDDPNHILKYVTEVLSTFFEWKYGCINLNYRHIFISLYFTYIAKTFVKDNRLYGVDSIVFNFRNDLMHKFT